MKLCLRKKVLGLSFNIKYFFLSINYEIRQTQRTKDNFMNMLQSDHTALTYFGTPSNSSTVMYTRVGIYTFLAALLPLEGPRFFGLFSLSSEDEVLLTGAAVISSSQHLLKN